MSTGAFVGRVKSVASGDMSVLLDDKKIQVAPGTILAASANVGSVAAGKERTVALAIKFYDKSSTLLSTVTGPDVKEIAGGMFASPYVIDAQVPLAAAVATLQVTIKATAAANEEHDIGNVFVTSGNINLLVDPHLSIDTGTDGRADAWDAYATGSGPAPAFSFDDDVAFYGKRSQKITVGSNGGEKGISQRVTFDGANAMFASAWVYSDQAITVRLSLNPTGVTKDIAAKTWTPISMVVPASEAASNDANELRITTSSHDCDFNVSGVSYGPWPDTDIVYDPEGYETPNGWSRGGIGGLSLHEIQRSDDGGKTWVDVRRLSQEPDYDSGIQGYEFDDYEAAVNSEDVLYRARKLYTDPTGLVISSLWSKPIARPSSLTVDSCWLISLEDPDQTFAADVQFGGTDDRPEPSETKRMLGRTRPVTLRGKIGGEDKSFKLEAITYAEFQQFDGLRLAQKTIAFVDPIKGLYYVDLGKNAPATRISDEYQEIAVTAVEVDRPPVQNTEVLPNLADVVIPDTDPPTTGYVGIFDDPAITPYLNLMPHASELFALSSDALAANKCIQVQYKDGTVDVIGFDGDTGVLDTVTLLAGAAAHAVSGDKTTDILKFYDQSGNGRDADATISHAYRIVDAAGALVTKTTNGITKAAPSAPDGTRGYKTASFPTYSGRDISILYVTAIQSASSSAGSPKGVSFWGASGTDSEDLQGIYVGRNGSTSVTEGYKLTRNRPVSDPRLTLAGTYDTMQQVSAVVKDNGNPTFQLALNGGTPVNSGTTPVNLGPFAITTMGFGGAAGASTWISIANQRATGAIAFLGTVPVTVRAKIEKALNTYYGLSSPAPDDPPPVTTGPFTLVATDSLDSQNTPLPSSEWMVYDNGIMTSKAGAWMARNVSVHHVGTGDDQIWLKMFKNATQQVRYAGDPNPFFREGAAVFWRGPSGIAFQEQYNKDHLFEVEMLQEAGSGYANVLIGWARRTDLPSSDPQHLAWPLGGEADAVEMFTNNPNRLGGASFWHLDTKANSSRALQTPSGSNYGVDWKTWHKVSVAFVHGTSSRPGFYELFIDEKSVARVTDQSFVPHDPNTSGIRWGLQQECYGMTDAASASGPFYTKLRNFSLSTYTG